MLDQQPINIIMKTGHSTRYIAIAAPNLIKCVPMSSFFIPSLTSLIALTASHKTFIIWAEVTRSMMPPLRMVEIGEFWVVPK